MADEQLHRFEHDGRRFALDVETCFCFECDQISWDVLAYYPHVPVNRILYELKDKHDPKELDEVIGELEWLRSTKSILQQLKPEDYQKRFELESGLKRLTVFLDRNGKSLDPALVRDAALLLIGRSGPQTEQTLELVVSARRLNAAALEGLCRAARKQGVLSGKKLTLRVLVEDIELAALPKSLQGHGVAAAIEIGGENPPANTLKAIGSGGLNLARLAKTLTEPGGGHSGRIVILPRHPDFGHVVQTLDEAGFPFIELDLEYAFTADPHTDPRPYFASMEACAKYYAERLLRHHYFRVDPIAPLFWQIYNGAPRPRTDPAGANALAVDADGAIYPSRHLMRKEFRCGSLVAGTMDEAVLKPFDDLGAMTTAPCVRCWARNLCGGGHASVHHARTGAIHTPDPAWCDAQRAWLHAAISAFNLLSSAGVNFQRVYSSLDRAARPSLFSIAKAVFRMQIGLRPIEERDAATLVRWENWDRSAYFLLNERGLVLGNRYEREMDALHPRPGELEAVLLRRDGSPFGLFKVRPDRLPGVAEGFLYFRDPADYTSGAVRRSFKTVLKEAAGQQSMRRLVVPAAPWETDLQTFLEALGFIREGALRQALYTQGRYHDVWMYRIATD